MSGHREEIRVREHKATMTEKERWWLPFGAWGLGGDIHLKLLEIRKDLEWKF